MIKKYMTNWEVARYIEEMAHFFGNPNTNYYGGCRVMSGIQNLKQVAEIVLLNEESVHKIHDKYGKDGLMELPKIGKGRASLLEQIFKGESQEVIVGGLSSNLCSTIRKISKMPQVKNLVVPRGIPPPFRQRF